MKTNAFAAVVELRPDRPLMARDAGADVVIEGRPRDRSSTPFLLGLFTVPFVLLSAMAASLARSLFSRSEPAAGVGLVLLCGVGAAICAWLVFGLLRDRHRDRKRDALVTSVRVTIRANDAVVHGPGDQEREVSLDEALQLPALDNRNAAVDALIRVRQALAKAKPDSPRRRVLEAAAIEDALLGGFGDEGAPRNLFVVLRREGRTSAVVEIMTRESDVRDMLSSEPPSSLRVYAVPTVRGVDDRRHPIIDVARVFEWRRPASTG